jgi:hypothetical protein
MSQSKESPPGSKTRLQSPMLCGACKERLVWEQMGAGIEDEVAVVTIDAGGAVVKGVAVLKLVLPGSYTRLL